MTHSTRTWHADHDLLASYVAGSLDAVTGASVEQHLIRCGGCRETLGPLVEPRPLELAWTGIRDAIESPSLPLPIRLARRCGLPDSTAVLLAAAASLRTAWLAGAFVAVGFATLAALLSGGQALAPFLLVAPLMPVIGVAAAYGSHDEGLETLVVSTPHGRTRLILTRTLAVLMSVLPATALLGLLLPGPPWLAVAWLGPALSLVPVLLALSSFVGPRNGAAVVALVWCGIVVFSSRGLPGTWLLHADQQPFYLVLALLALAVLAIRTRADHRIGAVL